MPGRGNQSAMPHVVIVGGGFGGLYAARQLANHPVRVTLVDKRNFHLFQPLLYQIATGSLSPGDIASPLRSILKSARNIEVLMDEVIGLDPVNKQVALRNSVGHLDYDLLILATGGQTHYFGHDQWATCANSLKSVEDALDMRRQIFAAFEAAEQETDPKKRESLMTFVIVGGGPTGVELAGALAQLAHFSLRKDFKNIDTTKTKIILVEASPKILNVYPDDLSKASAHALEKLGVALRTGVSVTDIQDDCITLSDNGASESIQANTVLWAAGVKASGLGQVLADQTGCPLDRGGRVMVEPDLSISGYPDIFVIGDLANYSHTEDKKPLPGVAPVAIQEGKYVAQLIIDKIHGDAQPAPFQYHDKGSLAVIGLKEAVADLGQVHLTGFIAWLIWAFVHIQYLIGFDNKLVVMFQWFWTYLTRKQGARLITGPGVYD